MLNTPRISWRVNWLTDEWRCVVGFFKLGQHEVLTEVLPFGTGPNYVHTYCIRHPAAEYATLTPDVNLTRLSPPCMRVWPARLFCSLFKNGETSSTYTIYALLHQRLLQNKLHPSLSKAMLDGRRKIT